MLAQCLVVVETASWSNIKQTLIVFMFAGILEFIFFCQLINLPFKALKYFYIKHFFIINILLSSFWFI